MAEPESRSGSPSEQDDGGPLWASGEDHLVQEGLDEAESWGVGADRDVGLWGLGGFQGLFLISVLAGLTLWFDLQHPLGVAGAVPYVALPLVGLVAHSARLVVVGGVLGTLLTAVGFWFSTPGASLWVVLMNRVLALFALWVVAVTGLLYQRSLSRFHAQLRRASEIDALTGIYNRRRIQAELVRRTAETRRRGSRCAVLILDIDHFKDINDTLGHLAGDQALLEVCRLCQSSIRQEDLLGRYGGDELLIVAPGIGAEGAHRLGERIRRAVGDAQLVYREQPVALSVSIGGATVRTDDSDDSVTSRADRALYRAKRDGRNRTVVVGPLPDLSITEVARSDRGGRKSAARDHYPVSRVGSSG